MLARDVKKLVDDPSTPDDLRELARSLHGRYAYPVDTQLIAPDGRLLGQLPANEVMMSGAGVGLDRALRQALEEVRPAQGSL